MSDQETTSPSRRTLLGGLGATVATLAAAGPVVAGKRSKKKATKKARKLCKRQRGQCEAIVEAQCAFAQFPENCVKRVFECCAHLETCNAELAYPCLFPSATL